MPVYQDGNSSAGVVSFENKFALPNDGTQVTQTATVTNRLNKEITIHIPFYMKPGQYNASNGQIIENKEYGAKQLIEVKATIPANSSKEVKVTR